MLEEKEKLLQKNRLFHIRRYTKEANAFERGKRYCLVLAVFLSLLIIGTIYFMSDISNIYRITIRGNSYLSDEMILEMSGLNQDSKFLLTFPFMVERKVKNNELIADCKVERADGRLLIINVTEKKLLGYTFTDKGNVLLAEGGEFIPITQDNISLIAYVPVIEGFDEKALSLIAKNLIRCDTRIINEISEIHNYQELKFQNIMIVMRDGNYIFSSAYGLEILNKYFDMISSYHSTDNQCYYFEDISGNAYTSACPWEPEEEKKEEDKKEEGDTGEETQEEENE